jgi:tetratricopeptide (TPR) repeat protein
MSKMPFVHNLMQTLGRHPRLTAFVSTLILLGLATAGVFGWAQYHLAAAQRALERYAFDEAQHHLDLCLKVRAGSADIRLLAAQTARRRDAYEEAEQHLAAALQLGGINESLALERSLLAAQQGNYDNVERSLHGRTAADYPEAVVVLEALAKGYAGRYKQGQLQVCLNILLDRDPRHPEGLLMRARLWEQRAAHGEKEFDQDALRDYQQAVEVNPTFEARLGLAATLYRVGRPYDAMIEYEQLQQIQPADSEVILGLARCRYSLNEVDHAKRLLDALLEQHPNHAAALLERGRLALHEGRLPEAETWLRQAAAQSPRFDCTALRDLIRCLEAESKMEEARRWSDDVARTEMDLVQIAQLNAQAKREPQNVPLRYEIAKRLMDLGREQDAVSTFALVVEQDPRHVAAHEALAAYYQRTGQPSRASRHRRAGVSPVGINSPGR